MGRTWKVTDSKKLLIAFPLPSAESTSPVFLPRWKSRLRLCTCSKEAMDSSRNEYWLTGTQMIERTAPRSPLFPCSNLYKMKRQMDVHGTPRISPSSPANSSVILPT